MKYNPKLERQIEEYCKARKAVRQGMWVGVFLWTVGVIVGLILILIL